MNFWATFSICLMCYLMYAGHLNNELQEIKSILIIVYESMEKHFSNVFVEIEFLKVNTLAMLDNLQNTTLQTWDAVIKNGKKISNLDEKINVLLTKNGVEPLNV
ncbi:gp16 [Palpita vitrealis nucleopolyhedrovirus]|uniref:Gp16 n=1 Tax=Palpita vitrealis nucleopolyhedrovirus TaxID=2951960 RepID=A0AAE9RYS8_9ABAC|nr:gp16 [Palpita vitrealis nucleopolyhedrovirus]